jgi:hypothetical protein
MTCRLTLAIAGHQQSEQPDLQPSRQATVGSRRLSFFAWMLL